MGLEASGLVSVAISIKSISFGERSFFSINSKVAIAAIVAASSCASGIASFSNPNPLVILLGGIFLSLASSSASTYSLGRYAAMSSIPTVFPKMITLESHLLALRENILNLF